MKTSTITLILFLFLTVHSAYGETPIMPIELSESARSHGCQEVSDFYKDRPGMLDPVYVYGYLSGRKENSAVFWCQAAREDKRTFFLVVYLKESKPSSFHCPAKVQWNNYPGGLSIYENRDTSLDGFVYLNQPSKRVPPGKKLTSNAIRSEYDGVETLFYCYKGEWLVRQRH